MSRVLIWLARATAAIAFALVASIALLLLLMWSEHNTPLTLPVPTGPFAVGRVTFAWTNPAETDDLASEPNWKRQVLVWLWYPAASSPQGVTAEYLPPAWRTALASHMGLFMNSFLKRDPASVRAHSLAEAKIAPAKPAYPVVLLRAGGSALTTDFTTLAEDLASHGFFVAGFDAPHRSFVVVLPDGHVVARSPAATVENAGGNLADPRLGKLLAMWTLDSRFVVSQLRLLNDDPSSPLQRRMDFGRLGVFGHSFGGATALEFCREESLCKAAIDMDGIPFGPVVSEGLHKPGMFLLSDHSREMADPESRQVLARIQSVYERMPGGRMYAVIRRANHFSFSDQILLNSPAALALLRLTGFGGLDGRRGLAITADYARTFFDV